MDAAQIWRDCFRNWPAELPRRGVLITAFNEQIAFDGFGTSDQLLLVDRRTPDTSGARQVLLGYGQVLAVKITDVVKPKAFQALGFEDRKPAGKKAEP